MDTASVAIWNQNKFISMISMGVWGANIPFLILGRSLPLRHGGDHGSHLNLILFKVLHG